AKAAIYGLNQTGRRPYELEEARIVQSLVREDGLSQLDAAELLGRHKSWVCRRLALLEKLCADVRQDLEVGLLTPTVARELARLPAGNQSEVLDVGRRDALSGAELGGVVRLILESVTAEQRQFVLAKPREALGHVRAGESRGWDPRLSASGNRVSKQLAALLDRLAWTENFLECRGWTSLVASDRLVLGPIFDRLARDRRRRGGASSTPTKRRSPRSWRVIPRSRRDGSTRSCAGSVTRGVTRSSQNACDGCVRGRSAHRCGDSRPPRGCRHRWIIPHTILISRTKAAVASTPS